MPPKAPAAPQGERRSSFTWKTVVWIVGVQLLITTLLGSFTSSAGRAQTVDAQRQSGPASSPRRPTTARAHSEPGLRPMARPGDPFSLTVECDVPGFEPIVFPHLRFHHDMLMATPNRTVHRMINLSECARHNCSADVRIIWSMHGEVFEDRTPLIRFFADKKKKSHLLLHRKEEDAPVEGGVKTEDAGDYTQPPSSSSSDDSVTVYRAYIQPTLTLSPVVDFTTPLPPNALDLVPRVGDEVYGPVVYINNFWVLRSHLMEVNATTASEPLPFTVQILPVPLWKVLMYTQFDASASRQIGMTAQDFDETKRMFLETNPYLLGVTTLVTVLHMLFEYLAFTNDVKFWRGRKNFKGLSLRSVAVNCYFQTIIFLYLVDSQDTSWTILLPSGIGVLTEYWKLTQVVQLVPARHPAQRAEEPDTASSGSVSEGTAPSSAFTLFGYSLQFRSSYDTRTRRYDQDAIRFLSYAMIPVLLCYSVYSLVHTPHKSWYSFLIHTQVQFVYMFGFVMMLPQIFVNYKMKSVGQVPWRTFVYKALNTVIDDLFAFVVKMPWLHRLACFRDDVVFVILLYQRWIYPVDSTRTEDGQDVDDENAEAAPERTVSYSVDDSKKKQ